MAYNKTLGAIRTSVCNQTNMTVGDNEVITTEEANDYINTALSWVHGFKVTSGLSYDEETQTITTSGNGLATYSLAEDFYTKVGVDCYRDGYWTELYEIMPQERNCFQESDSYPVGFRITNSDITLYPTPTGSVQVRVIYVPSCPVLVDDDDSVDFGNAWNELVEIEACIKFRQKEDDATGNFERRKELLLERIQQEVEQRSLTQPLRLLEHRHPFDPWWGGRWGLNNDDY